MWCVCSRAQNLWLTQSKEGKWFVAQVQLLNRRKHRSTQIFPFVRKSRWWMRDTGHPYGCCLQEWAFFSLCILASELLSLIYPVHYVPAAPKALVLFHHSMAFHTSESLQRLFLCLESSFFTSLLHHTAEIQTLLDTCLHQDGSVILSSHPQTRPITVIVAQ